MGIPLGPKTVILGVTNIVCNLSRYWSRGQTNERQNNLPRRKNNGAAGYLGSVKIELRKGVEVYCGSHTLLTKSYLRRNNQKEIKCIGMVNHWLPIQDGVVYSA